VRWGAVSGFHIDLSSEDPKRPKGVIHTFDSFTILPRPPPYLVPRFAAQIADNEFECRWKMTSSQPHSSQAEGRM
jgi:hypothetical protein